MGEVCPRERESLGRGHWAGRRKPQGHNRRLSTGGGWGFLAGLRGLWLHLLRPSSWELPTGPTVSRLQCREGAFTWDTSPPQARSPHPPRPHPPMTLTLPDHPPESLQPGEAWRPLAPGSPVRAGAPRQDLPGPCSASGHPQPGHTAARSHTSPHPTLTSSPIRGSPPRSCHLPPSLSHPDPYLIPHPQPDSPALGALTGFPGCTTGISVEWPRSRGVLAS